MPWILGGIGVLVVIALAIGAFLAFGGSGGDPQEVAQAVVDEMNKLENADAAKLESLTCSAEKDTIRASLDELNAGFKEIKEEAGDDFSAKFILGDVRTDGDTGTFDLTVEASFQGETSSESFTGQLLREDGDWKVCDLGSGS